MTIQINSKLLKSDRYNFTNWSKYVNKVICTDISKDGMLEGPNTDLYAELHEKFPQVQFIASGGVSKQQDVKNCMQAGCSGVIVGKALYEGRIKL